MKFGITRPLRSYLKLLLFATEPTTKKEEISHYMVRNLTFHSHTSVKSLKRVGSITPKQSIELKDDFRGKNEDIRRGGTVLYCFFFDYEQPSPEKVWKSK